MRMWEIREGDSNYGYGKRGGMMGKKDPVEMAYEEGYDCGYEEGYEKGMKDSAHSYGERGMYGERRMR